MLRIHRSTRTPSRTFSFALLVALVLASHAPAQTNWTLGPATSGDWFTPANWSLIVPTSSVDANIRNSSTALIGSGSAAASTLVVGDSTPGTIEHSGGQLSLSALVVGNSSTVSTYRLSGTANLSAPNALTIIGRSGIGAFEQSGGTFRTTQLIVASGGLSTGSYSLSGGTLTVGSTLAIGLSTPNLASFVQTGGSIVGVAPNRPDINVGYTNATGSYTFSGGSIAPRQVTIWKGKYVQSAGTMQASAALNVSLGSLEYGGGSITANAFGLLDSTSKLIFDLDPQSVVNAMTITTTSAFNGTLEVDLANTTGLDASDTFTLLDAGSNITGSFLNVASGSRLSVDSGSFLVSYGAGSPFGGDKLVLSDFQAPEPSAGTLTLFACAALLRRRTRVRCA